MTQDEKIDYIIADTDKNYAPYYSSIPHLIRTNKYKRGIEIGVFCGGHAVKILQTGAELIGIDTYQMYDPGMPNMESQSDWELLYEKVMQRMNANYSHMRMTSDEAFELLKDQMFDFVFIDGLHTYEQLKRDMENYSRIIRKGGVISMHDYMHPYFPDLTNAINEFVAEHRATLVICPLHLVYTIKNWE